MIIPKRYPIRFASIIFTLLWLATAQSLHAQEKIRIGISTASLGFLPTVVAEKKGFYAKYGLTPEHVQVACAIATNALLSDDLDYAVCTGPGISGAIKGLPIKLVVTTQDKLGYLLLGQTQGSETRRPSRQNHRHQHLWQPGISDDGRRSFGNPVWNPGKTSISSLPGTTAPALPAMDAGKIDAAIRFLPVGYLRREERI